MLLASAAAGLAGCAPERTPPRGADAASDRTRQALVPRAEALLANEAASGEAVRPEPPVFPADLGSHPDMPFESRSWYVVLNMPDGSVRALRQRFDRVALDAPADRAASDAPGASEWRFDALMQVSGAHALLPGAAAGQGARRAGPTSGWQQVQRVALGLAEAGMALASGSARAAAPLPGSVGLPGAPSDRSVGRRPPESGFGVLAHRLAFRADDAGCAGRYRLSGPATGTIEVRQPGCPAGDAVGTLARAGSGAMIATAGDGSRGVAWQRHVWGALPDGGGAVRFDVATLTLRKLGTLELLRSRRRSGRGTPVVTARLLAGDRWRKVRDIDWPLDADGGGAERVRSDSLGVNVTLSRLALTGEPGPLPDPVAWRGVLFAKGSHAGAGFAELAGAGSDT